MELKSVIKKVQKAYPKDQELIVEFYTDLPIGVADSLQDEDSSNLEKMVQFVKHIVADWNFADENGIKLERTEDNIKLLGADLISWIVQEGSELVKPDADKKKE